MNRTTAWSKAYARQAEADFKTWDVLQRESATLKISECHRLMFLQMACEKLTKAHLCRAGSKPEDLQSKHTYTTKNLPTIIRQQALSSGMTKEAIQRIERHAKHLSREIELLTPSAKGRPDNKRPDNCEYPWEDAAGNLHLPIDSPFYPSQLIAEPTRRNFLKHVRRAIEDLVQ